MSTLDAHFHGRHGVFSLDAAFSLPMHGVSALFGPSGCGKTTILRNIAGLNRMAGHLRVGDTVWQDEQHSMPAHARAVGYVFQEASLFPHLSVRANLDYALRRARSDQDGSETDSLIDALGLAPLLPRMPARLSGGERQRVAIARALLTRPRVLLMDEPLSALDGPARDDILDVLETLPAVSSAPIVYVSHAIDEVARLADTLVVLDGGRVLAHGPTNEILTRADLSLAHSEHAGSVFHGRIAAHHANTHLTEVDSDGGRLLVSAPPSPVGRTLRLRIAARDVSIALSRPTDSSIINHLPVSVIDICPDPNPGHRLVRLAAGKTVLLARITTLSRERLGLVPGMTAWALIKGVAVR
ncbi:MAG: molybdenum ABC transporter ATP-binding protein [Rhodocyclaceae bacterium]|nr:molybdenum ABC transporter ATP-binding protein [Rhodocyclaceae bacterium]